jgi:hypothetical protein
MRTKKTQAVWAAVALMASICFASQAFAWGSATHAYISDNLSKGDRNPLQKIYGNMAGDVFGYMSGHPAQTLKLLYWVTHYDSPLPGYPAMLPSYLDPWEKARTVLGKAAAFGFVSHNGEMGADVTAHGSYDYTVAEPDGCVIVQAKQMAAVAEHWGLGISGTALYELCHIFVESAIDLKIAEHHPLLGAKISAAALFRTPEFPVILVETYAGLLATLESLDQNTAKLIVRKAESDFRSLMISYGHALSQANARELVADQLAALAPAFLAANAVELPPGIDIGALSDALLSLAYYQFTDGYDGKVAATIQWVRENLGAHGHF